MNPEKAALIAGMDERRASNLAIVNAVPLELVVHSDSGWTVKDLVAHMIVWEMNTIRTLEAGMQGQRYLIPGFEDGIHAYNERTRMDYIDESGETILALWASTREQLRQIVRDYPEERWQEPLRWFGADALPVQVVKGIGSHEKHHIQEIASAAASLDESGTQA